MIIRKSIVFAFIVFLFASQQGWAMATNHRHFVDINTPEQTIQNQPRGQEGTFRKIATDDFVVIISYPMEHDFQKKPHGIVARLRVRSASRKVIYFRIAKWTLLDETGKVYEPKVEYPYEFKERGYLTVGSLSDRKFNDSGLGHHFLFYYNLPKHLDRINLEFAIEITLPDGRTETVQDVIPLKKAIYKTSFFKGLMH